MGVCMAESLCCSSKTVTGLFVNQLSLFSYAHSLQPQELQHARPPYPSPSPGVCPSSCSSAISQYKIKVFKKRESLGD